MTTILQNFYKATITKNWTATTGDFNVSVKPTTSSGWLVVSPNNTTLREIIYYTATGTNAYGDFVTVSDIGDRGIGGTTAQIHSIGETVRMNITAEHWAEIQSEIDAIIAAGAPNASTTTKGLVEEATDAEVIAGTDTGATGAKLFIPPSKNGTKFPGTSAFSGTAPTTMTDLDLSSIVGVRSRMVLLKVTQSTATAIFSFRKNGDSGDYDISTSNSWGASKTRIANTPGSQYITVLTDSSGVIEWACSTGSTTTAVTVEAYW